MPLPPARMPAWSPDSSKIAYVSEGCVTGEWDIYVGDAGGKEATRLTSTPDKVKEGTGWSPSASSIVFAGSGSLWKLDVATRTLREVVAGGGGDQYIHYHGRYYGSWGWGSQDGRYVLFSAGGGHGVCD